MRKLFLFLLNLLIVQNTLAKRQVITIDMDGGALNKKWTNSYDEDYLNVKSLLLDLKKSKTGKRLIRMAIDKAYEYGETITDVIKPGVGSLTDTTLIRRFSVSNPQHMTFETKSKVFINRDLNRFDAILDLAHELTHFVYRKNFNPYQKNFSLYEFIQNTIEGTGGEVQAFLNECQVVKEIFPKQLTKRYNCQQILDEQSGELSLKLAVEKFYYVGSFYDLFKNKMNKHSLKFPQISSRDAVFISSAYGMPYPMAAYKEYVSVLSKVCANDKKRLVYMLESNSGRSPASHVKNFEKDYSSRCSNLDHFL